MEGLRYAYPGSETPALDVDRLELAEGITGLVGVNGAGKSTLLRILARVIERDSGVIKLDGVDLVNHPRSALARQIGFMPQEFALPSGARVLDSLRYLSWLKGLSDREAEVRSLDLLGALGLADRRAERVSSLSGGMRRRLALAQALLAKPEVLLLDEPTTGLDPEQRVIVRELLADHNVRAGTTIVSSHVMEDVETLADRVVLLDAGSVAFDGSVADFCRDDDGAIDDAEAAFVRRLIGSRQ